MTSRQSQFRPVRVNALRDRASKLGVRANVEGLNEERSQLLVFRGADRTPVFRTVDEVLEPIGDQDAVNL